MIAILYPLKMDKNLSEAYSSIYKEGTKYGLTKGTGKPGGAMKDYLDKKAKKLQREYDNQSKEKKNNPAFQSSKLNPQPQYNSRYRKEWEALKLMEQEEYAQDFNEWKSGLVEEGYDISRWSESELVETFINEHDLWKSKDAIMKAISESDKKGSGSGKKDACYKKVKASASVWPSAYASGRLVQCRKKGAANYGNSKKEAFSDWRDDLGLLDENRATAYTAGMSDGQKSMEMRKISPKVADEAGRSHDKFMFGNRKKSGKTNKEYNKKILKDKKYNQNTTGRGMPVSYRDSYEKDRDDVIQSKIRQGKGSIKDLGKKK